MNVNIAAKKEFKWIIDRLFMDEYLVGIPYGISKARAFMVAPSTLG
jgi:hypothetical protein